MIIADALRIPGEGFKVAVEICVMASRRRQGLAREVVLCIAEQAEARILWFG
jgi:hypothetical protein